MKYLNRIKEEAAIRNIPLKQLADSIHISEAYFKKALRNNKLSIEQLQTICNELSIDVSEIFVLKKPVQLNFDRNLSFLGSKVFC